MLKYTFETVNTSAAYVAVPGIKEVLACDDEFTEADTSSDLEQKYVLSDGQVITRGAELNRNLRLIGVDLVLVPRMHFFLLVQVFAEDQMYASGARSCSTRATAWRTRCPSTSATAWRTRCSAWI